MRDSPGSVVTLLCSGIQLYSAERRIADCILNDVKWASVVTSAQLARASQSSEATVTRLCHKLGFDNYRKFQLALARDVMDQQETETQRSTSPDPLRQALQSVQANRQRAFFLLTYAWKTYWSIRRKASSMRERGEARFIRRWQGPWNIFPSCTATPTSQQAFSTSSMVLPWAAHQSVQSTKSI